MWNIFFPLFTHDKIATVVFIYHSLVCSASRWRRAYILSMCFFSLFFFSMPNLWGHWTDLNQTWAHIYFWLLLKNLARTLPGIYNPRAGGGPHFGTEFELLPNISLQQNITSTIGKKRVSLQGLPYMPPNLVNYGLETAENGWRVFAPSKIFALRDTASFTAWTLYNGQQANVYVCLFICLSVYLSVYLSDRISRKYMFNFHRIFCTCYTCIDILCTSGIFG